MAVRNIPAAYIRRRAYLLAREEARGVGAAIQPPVEQVVHAPVLEGDPVLDPGNETADNNSGSDSNLDSGNDSADNDDGDFHGNRDSENDNANNDNEEGGFRQDDNDDSDNSGGSSDMEYEAHEGHESGDSDDAYEDVNVENDPFTTRLAKWSCFYGITLEATTALLDILREDHPQLPKTAEALRHTPKRKVTVKDLNNGQYVHFGFGNLFRSIDAARLDSIEVEIGCDGFPIFGSTGTECWPLLAKCAKAEIKTPDVIGIFYGTGKPEPLRDFLDDFMNDVRDYIRNGVVIRNRRLPFSIKYFVCDAAARAYLRCVYGSTSHNGCDKCEQEGYTVDHVCVFSTVAGRLRTDQSFRDQRDMQHHNGISPLLDIPIEMVSKFPIEPMHLIDLGVMRRFMEFTMGRGNLEARMGPAQKALLNDLLLLVHNFIPSDFGRKLRSLKLFWRWKADECRQFLLYVGPVLLGRVLSENVFGETFVSYNVHSLLHIVSEARLHGTLSSFSAYPFENELRHLKNLVKAPPRPLQQICKRIQERKRLNCLRRTKPSRHFIMTHDNGPLGDVRGAVRQFKKYEDGNYCLSIAQPDNCVTFANGQIGLIYNFVESDEGVHDNKLAPAVVPESWLTENGTKCFWPPVFKESLYKKGPGPNFVAENIVLRGTYNTYAKARSLLSKAEETSNIESDEGQDLPAVRKRNPGKPARYQTTDSDEEIHQTKKIKIRRGLCNSRKISICES
ncbi:Halomucin [Frankliniella fusca]|uniref:Halomucin n=1 Tax=Frankliniella fusca TaxID=407009 RepID=A0AAE1I200_9NEOP|nr:Halomucin [Frankliniella fusca]